MAREMERKIAALPASAGVLFVGVQAQPSESGGGREFFVRLGLVRHLTEAAGKALIRQALAAEMKAGIKIFAGVYRGISGARRDDGPSTARPTAA